MTALRGLFVLLAVFPLIFCSPTSAGPDEHCPIGAEMSDCSGCSSHCQPPGTACVAEVCKKGCKCKESGYLIKEDRCVPESECQSCPIGAEMSDCSGCSSHCQPPGTACPKMCKTGCKCKESGYLIKGDRCVPESECQSCPIGAKMSDCSGCSSYCQPPGKACVAICKRGCKCKKSGYVIKGDCCVPERECQSCPIGAEMSDCSGCSSYCQPSGTACPDVCKRGCKCKKSGYVIKGDRCVPIGECQSCPIGAAMSDCSGCSSFCQPPGMACPEVCKKGCKCQKSGYVIKGDRCVPESECHSCPIGAEWSNCSGCSAYCQPPGVRCLMVCKEGCKCKDGNQRIKGDRCVPASECQSCPIGAEWSDCSGCSAYCQPPEVKCLMVCEEGCKCKDGNQRIKGDRCVPLTEC